jgi:hypothetical protein
MRIYLELYEISEDLGEEADFIRIDITDWDKRDIDTAIQLLREHAQIYPHRIIQIHYCKHEEGEPCYVEVLEAV